MVTSLGISWALAVEPAVTHVNINNANLLVLHIATE
jgi:hypothetical protein